MRFRKRVKVFPGFYLNFSASGISSTFGFRGASITVGKSGSYINAGIPGTGLYDRKKISGQNPEMPKNTQGIRDLPPILEQKLDDFELTGAIISKAKEDLMSSSLLELKDSLEEAFKERIETANEIIKCKSDLRFATIIYWVSVVFLFGLVVNRFKIKVKEKRDDLDGLMKHLDNCVVNIGVDFDSNSRESYLLLERAFGQLIKSQMIWDITARVNNDSVSSRSLATESITRRLVHFDFVNIDIINSVHKAFHMENANGDDLYFYPGFVIITKNKKDFGLMDLMEVLLKFDSYEFLETEKIPSDTLTVRETWAKVNKNGQPDKRFKNNYRIPIVKYGLLELRTNSGLNESYCISNFEFTEIFANSFIGFQRNISSSGS